MSFRGSGRGGGRGRGGFSSRGGRDHGEENQTFPETEKHPIIIKNEKHAPVTTGKPVELVANYFKVDVDAIVVYQHDLNISIETNREKSNESGDTGGIDAAKRAALDNERMQKFISNSAPLVFEQLRKKHLKAFQNLQYIYDNSKNVYATKDLEKELSGKTKLEVNIGGRMKQFLVKFKMVQKIDLSMIYEFYLKKSTNNIEEVVVHFMESLFRQLAAQKYAIYNRNLFDATNTVNGSKNWMNFANGFTNACRITEFGLSINIHLKTCSLISPNVETLEQLVLMISQNQNIAQLRTAQITDVNKIIKSLKIYTDYGGRKSVYTIKALTNAKPKECSFEIKKDGQSQTITMIDYFRTKYNISLNANYPVVSVVGRNNLRIPLEFCKMVDKQFLNHSKLDANMQNDMLHIATHKPVSYFSKLTTYTKQLAQMNPTLMKEFGTTLSPKPISFFGRVLDTPKQICEKRNDKFYCVANAKPKWAFISLDPNFQTQAIDRFAQDLQRSGRNVGLDFQNCFIKKYVQLPGGNAEQKLIFDLFQQLKTNGCQLVIVALPQYGNSLYGLIKHCGDQNFGIATQCLNGAKALNRRGGYIENILLKINGKMNGKNFAIDPQQYKQIKLNNDKTMVIGIDVNHPGQVEKVESSIAVAVGSYDNQFTLYTASIRVLEKNRSELVNKIDEMIVELLKEYQKINKYYPETLIIFRDGVSDGQTTYAQQEITDIRKALRQYVPKGKIIYITMQKGHHTRFVLAKPMELFGRPTQNVPSGTIIDNTIVEPSQNMFFLNSHFSQLGTSKPMKYLVMCNDYDPKVFNNESLQKFCYLSCFGCTRFRGAIAIPVSIRYADLCAYRAKIHVEAQLSKAQMHGSTKVSADNQQTLEQNIIKKLNTFVKLNDSIKNSLYYA